ncbi:MAG: DUF2218 domain-containing protein [Ancalomicrobiaceae bacterium]|nr:DUF2218 domain-containing protein [Ancalomicrobiaceae bacterium]
MRAAATARMRAEAILPTTEAGAYLARLSAAFADRIPEGHAVDAVVLSFPFGRYRVEQAGDTLRLDLESGSEEGLAWLKTLATSHLARHRAGTAGWIDWNQS